MAQRVPLEAVLFGLEMRRETGKLTVESKTNGTCNIYFLEGHLYHAVGPAGEGAVAVTEAKSWEDLTHSFDASARLATYENIGEEAEYALRGDDSPAAQAELRRQRIQLGVLLVILVVIVSLVVTHLPTH